MGSSPSALRRGSTRRRGWLAASQTRSGERVSSSVSNASWRMVRLVIRIPIHLTVDDLVLEIGLLILLHLDLHRRKARRKRPRASDR
jgi:hypothetical protein